MNEREAKLICLIRSGNILNGLGVYRAAHIYGNSLTREQFIELVKRNWMSDKLTDRMKEKLEEAWNQAIRFLKAMDLDLGSNKEVIKYKEPTLCFDI